MVRTNRKLPKEWAKFSPVGNVVEGTRVFAFKTPLGFELVKKYKKDDRFTVPDLYRALLFRGQEVGLIINATNTNRYYDSREISAMGIEYVKLPMHGRGFADCENVVRSFLRTIDDFLERNKDNNVLIGIHCTDGVNRAGYLICRYLIDKMNLSSHDALNVVEAARGYTIERGALIRAVHRADKEKRLKRRRPNYDSEEEQENEKDKRKKKRRQAKAEVVEESHGELDPAMMQQIMQLEQSLNQSAQSSKPDPALEYQQQFFEQQRLQQQSSHIQLHQQYQQFVQTQSETSSPYVDSPQIEEEEEEERTIDYSIMGKIDVKQVSKSQQRRVRRKNLENKFEMMKRGKFWEIKEMQRK